MESTRSISYLEKLVLKLSLSIGNMGLKPLFFGAENSTGILNHYNGSDHLDSFGLGKNYFSSKNHDSLVIYGHVNLNQLQILKQTCEENKEFINLIVHIRGPLNNKLQSESYFLCNKLEDHLSVDVSYTKFPVDLEDLCFKIRKVQRLRIDG